MKNFEIIGDNSNKVNDADNKILKRIIESYSSELSKSELISNKMTGIKIRMYSYLDQEDNSELVNAGEFLTQVLKVYEIKKSKFADYLGLEKPNLHALLKGRRKINNLIAKKLELTFGIEDKLWLFVETKNEIKKFNKSHNLRKRDYTIKLLVDE